MKIVVCVKQVPCPGEVRFDKRNRIVREDVELMVNPLDETALAHALALRDAAGGGEVSVMTMGPPSAVDALRSLLGRGADRAVLLTDKRFGGADTLATARALARALEREQADVVLFGQSTIDGATAQVGPQVAELMGLPQLTEVAALSAADGRLSAERGGETWTAPLPTIVTVASGPELGDGNGAHSGAPVEEVTQEDLGGMPKEYGTRGSPTFVREVRELSASGNGHTPRRADGKRDQTELWVLAERDGDELHPLSLEGLTCAHAVAGELGAEVVAVLLCDEPADLPGTLARHGADRVLVVRHPTLAEYATEPHTAALAAAVRAREPDAIVAPWTVHGRDYVPRAAARLGTGLTGDFVRFEVAEKRDKQELLWVKPAYSETVEAPILSHKSPAIGTLRPGMFEPLPPDDSVDPRVDELAVEIAEEARCHRGDTS